MALLGKVEPVFARAARVLAWCGFGDRWSVLSVTISIPAARSLSRCCAQSVSSAMQGRQVLDQMLITVGRVVLSWSGDSSPFASTTLISGTGNPAATMTLAVSVAGRAICSAAVSGARFAGGTNWVAVGEF